MKYSRKRPDAKRATPSVGVTVPASTFRPPHPIPRTRNELFERKYTSQESLILTFFSLPPSDFFPLSEVVYVSLTRDTYFILHFRLTFLHRQRGEERKKQLKKIENETRREKKENEK